MKAYFEKVPAGTGSLVAFERSDPSFPFDWHYHPEFELTLILDSAGQRLVGDHFAEYGPGDLVLLGPNLPHTWRSTPSAADGLHRAIVIQFREDFLGDKFFNLPEMSTVSKLLKRCGCGLSFANSAAAAGVARRLAAVPSMMPGRRLAALLDTLLDLADEPRAAQLSTGSVRSLGRPADQQRLDTICRCLDENFENEIDYSRLAEMVHMEQASLCRFFKRATGRTMTGYVTELRVSAATHLLLETDLSVLDIGFRSGFGNYSNFSRQFKKLKGITPRELREQIAAANA